ncbi:LIC_11904 family protein [Leptospira mayottensis]|uniref:6-bladed beta-propeller n=1 Tax=Leptospira mayottensis TaxID=1137606 RepID=A0ABM6YDG3_9LEPT|nr:hypothetical protein [Leptospira mayottensis]AXR62448.1 hypothetical protein DQM68_11680 [Leptospira mayottensis]AXR66219.1 hypothetical protein DQM28_16070 [Leptospira mayottensis]AZQ03796.1 hypothetical protein LEP1GSC190_10030 [Leptospira mayottensis 200901116]TGM91279.1 hypothetical protein EHR03_18360 [Leptospira mayottensis]
MHCKNQEGDRNFRATSLQILSLFSQNSSPINRLEGNNSKSTNLQSSQLVSKFQLNPEIFENVGFLYTRNLNFPELRRIQDFSVVHLNDSIRDTNLSQTDVNLFILDSPKGNIIYSNSNQSIRYFHDDRIENYKQIYVLPNGKILFISSDNFLDLCYTYNATGNVTFTPNCIKTNIGAYSIFEFKPDNEEVILLDHQKQLKRFNTINNSLTALNINPQPTEVFSLAYNNGFLGVLENKGTKLTLFSEGNGRFNFTNSLEDFSFVTQKGARYNAPQFLGIAVNSSGVIYATCPSEDAIYSFNGDLRITDVYEFLPEIRPYKKIISPHKILISKRNEYLYVSNRSALEILKDSANNPSEDFQWILPVQSDSIENAFKSLVNSGGYDPNKSIFDQPGIKEIVQSWKGNL